MNSIAKFIKKILRILILILIIFIIYIKYSKYKVVSFESEFYKNFNTITKENVIYPFGNYGINDVFNGKVTVINIYSINDIRNLYNINLANKISESFSGDVNVVDIIIKNKDDFISEEVLNITSNEEESFIDKYKITRPVFSLTENDMKQYFNINNPLNKILIINEKGELEYIRNSGTDYNLILNDIINVSKHSKRIYKKSINDYSSDLILEDDNFAQSLSKFIMIENFENLDIPVFAILDGNRVLITKINGEVIYVINNNKFCQLTNLKYINGKIYLTDACNSSIFVVDFAKKKIDTFLSDNSLFGISDFEFIDENKIFVAKEFDYGIGILDIKTKRYENLTVKLNLDYKIGKVNRIVKASNKLYYLDTDMNVLYSYSNGKNSVEVDLNSFDNIVLYNKITNFYVNSKNNIYFVSGLDSKIFHYNGNEIEERDIKSSNPKDLLIYRNIYYVLSKDSIYQINWYANRNDIINFYFSNNTKNFFNINDISMNYKEYISSEQNIKLNNVIGDINVVPYSPSFILLFEKNNNEIFPVKIFYYESFLNNENITIDREYILYGYIYYNDNDKIKIKNINMLLNYNNKL